MGTLYDDDLTDVGARYAREHAGSIRHAFRYAPAQTPTVVRVVSLAEFRAKAMPRTPAAHETDIESRFNDHRYGDTDSERYSCSSSRYVQGEMERSVEMSRTSRHDEDVFLSSEEKAALVRRRRQQDQRFKFYSGSSNSADGSMEGGASTGSGTAPNRSPQQH